MRLIYLNEFGTHRESILFLNGGGQIPFSLHNKLVKFFINKYDFNYIAVELPGHGKSKFQKIYDQETFIISFEQTFRKIITDADIIVKAMIGFSLGGLLALKTIELDIFPVDYLIVYGCGFGIGENEKSTFDYYTSEQFFHDMRWYSIMKENHKNGWLNLLKSMNNLMNVNSPIFSDLSKINSYSEILLVLGDNEELFQPDYNKSIIREIPSNNIHLIRLKETSHFDYTSVSWEIFCSKLKEFIEIHNWFR
ncbi:MAG: 2-succinyl-6-hydroxy-2,4-cyclohexadiene-1-carboxylate synthase [Candidatus Heimdallarchaeota archaeon LC_2]|nr:MAG: 2-succinyl-6-hydroxy-2,4-cyclohexadiene-1-carboxylate synthase [Candidatus Heimdallarchaeota archaeon LC_2]